MEGRGQSGSLLRGREPPLPAELVSCCVQPLSVTQSRAHGSNVCTCLTGSAGHRAPGTRPAGPRPVARSGGQQ